MTRAPRTRRRRPQLAVVEQWGQPSGLYVYPEEHIGRIITRYRRFYEWDLLEAIAAEAQEGLFLDVGCHVGNHAAFFMRHCRAHRVHAFDPNPLVFPALAKNAELHGFTLHTVAVGSERRKAILNAPPEGNLGAARLSDLDQANLGGWQVRVEDLDGLGFGQVSVLKIDVEGRELDVLAGAAEILAESRPLVAAEAQNGPEAIDRVLRPLGYRRLSGSYCKTPTFIWRHG